MPEPAPDVMNVLARLEVLNGELRTLRRLGVYCLIFLIILLGILAWGVVRLQGRSGERNEIALRDENGKQRLWLGVVKGSPGLEFYDENQKVIGGLKMTPEEKGLILFDENGQKRAMLGVTKGEPSLILFDENGKATADLSDSKTGTALALGGENDKPRASLSVAKNRPVRNSNLILFDEDGKARANLGANKEANGLILGDETGRPRAGMTQQKNGPHLFLKDAKDKDIFSEPH